jgi:hypothetical protein
MSRDVTGFHKPGVLENLKHICRLSELRFEFSKLTIFYEKNSSSKLNQKL